jgi:predicted nucleic-acid-binding Zn-ribbon protein
MYGLVTYKRLKGVYIMKKTTSCPKCDSEEWVNGKLKLKGTALEIKFDSGEFLRLSNKKIEVYACKNCGFIELYLANKSNDDD